MRKIYLYSLVSLLTLFLTACSSKNNTNVQQETKSEPVSNNTNTTNSTQQNNVVNDKILLSVEEALQLFKNNFANYDLKSLSTEQINTANGYYEIEGISVDSEVKAKITVQKEIIKIKEELLDVEDRNGVEHSREAINISNLTSYENILKVAKTNLGEGIVQKISVERYNGIVYWSVTINNKEVDIDNNNLSIVTVDND